MRSSASFTSSPSNVPTSVESGHGVIACAASSAFPSEPKSHSKQPHQSGAGEQPGGHGNKGKN